MFIVSGLLECGNLNVEVLLCWFEAFHETFCTIYPCVFFRLHSNADKILLVFSCVA